MNKKELVELISVRTGVSKDKVSGILESTHEAIIEFLKKGEEVKIAGFGTFYVKKRESRKGRNPKTGEIIQIKEANIPKFRPGKTMKNI